MTLQPDGHTVCDKCGLDCGNGSVMDCAVVSVLADDLRVLNLHWCLATCAPRVLTATALANLPTKPTLYSPPPPAPPVPPPATGPAPQSTAQEPANAQPAAAAEPAKATRRRASPRQPK